MTPTPAARAARADLPSGTITLLFSDIEGSTRHVRRLGDRYGAALATHRRLMREAFERHRGAEVDTQGDAFFVVFERAADAVAGAGDALRALAAHDWEGGAPLLARIGIHTGAPTLSDGGYYVGLDLTRGARICAAAHGGQVLLSRATRELLPEHVEVRDLGEHLMKDLETTVRLFQLLGPGLRVEFPPPRARAPGNVPTPRLALVDRNRELGDLAELIRRDAALVTLTGAGGAGKTRLALEVARRVARSFVDGAFFVRLAGVDDAAQVLPAVAQVLDVREQPGEALEDALARTIGDRELLLLLDNFERVLPAAPLVRRLLDECPRLAVLATSRELLRVTAEVEYPVPTLPDADAGDLFAARATAANPDLDVGGGHRGEVLAICRRLDGLPLAIELAAANARVLPLQTILERLEQRIAFLADGPRDLPERQRTLRATIDWSYTLLDPDEQSLLTRLSVFAGGWPIEAAEQLVTPGDGALRLLTSLRDKSLIFARIGADGGARFGMLDTIAEYARLRLREQDGEGDARRAHAAYYLDLVERGAPELQGASGGEWLRRIAEEHQNIRAALTWALEVHEDDLLLRASGALWRFWFIRGHLSEGRLWLGRALERRPAVPSPALDGRFSAGRRWRSRRTSSRRPTRSQGSGSTCAAARRRRLSRERARSAREHRRRARPVRGGGGAVRASGDSRRGGGRRRRGREHRRTTAGTCRSLRATTLRRRRGPGARQSLFDRLGFRVEAAGARLNLGVALVRLGRLGDGGPGARCERPRVREPRARGRHLLLPRRVCGARRS